MLTRGTVGGVAAVALLAPVVLDPTDQGDPVSWAQWSGGWNDSNSHAAIVGQDARSGFDGTVATTATR